VIPAHLEQVQTAGRNNVRQRQRNAQGRSETIKKGTSRKGLTMRVSLKKEKSRTSEICFDFQRNREERNL